MSIPTFASAIARVFCGVQVDPESVRDLLWAHDVAHRRSCGARAAVTAIFADFGQDAIEAPPKSPRLDLERLDLMPKLLDLVRWLERRRDA